MSVSLSAILQILAIFAGTWFTWKSLKRLGIRDDLSRLIGPAPDSWITGSFLKLFDKNSWDYHDDLVKQYGKVFTFKGLFGQNSLYVIDPKAFYHIIVKDQMVYHETEEFSRTAWWMFGLGLFSTEGEHHRKQRKILNPVFSAAHLRDITPLFYEVASQLRDGLMQQVTQGETEVDMLSWMTRTALELIGRGGLGYSFGSLDPGAGEHPYAKSVKNMLVTLNDPLLFASRAILGHLTPYLGTSSLQRWAIEMLPWPKLREAKAMSDVMWNTSKEILENTKKCLAEGVEPDGSRVAVRKDILSILVKANMDAAEKDKLPEDEVMGQISTITFAGMDTTSNALSRILQLLSERPDVQERLRDEIEEAAATHGEELDYGTLSSLPFLEAVVRETLRLFAPVPFATRVPQQDMVLPLSKPVKTLDGEEKYELVVPKGTLIFLQLIKCNRDKDIWGPDAEEWKPERWLSPLPSSVTEANVPGVYANMYVPSGAALIPSDSWMLGSLPLQDDLLRRRACMHRIQVRAIGDQYAWPDSFLRRADQLIPEVVLSTLLRSFRFAPTDKKIIWQLTAVIQPTTEDAELTERDDGRVYFQFISSTVAEIANDGKGLSPLPPPPDGRPAVFPSISARASVPAIGAARAVDGNKVVIAMDFGWPYALTSAGGVRGRGRELEGSSSNPVIFGSVDCACMTALRCAPFTPPHSPVPRRFLDVLFVSIHCEAHIVLCVLAEIFTDNLNFGERCLRSSLSILVSTCRRYIDEISSETTWTDNAALLACDANKVKQRAVILSRLPFPLLILFHRRRLAEFNAGAGGKTTEKRSESKHALYELPRSPACFALVDKIEEDQGVKPPSPLCFDLPSLLAVRRTAALPLRLLALAYLLTTTASHSSPYQSDCCEKSLRPKSCLSSPTPPSTMTISTVAVLQILAIFAGTWFTWKFLKRLGTRDDLSRLAGPSPDSWITGSFLKLLDEDSWEYHDDLVKHYGKAFTFKGLFGQNCLYVIDPKALYHIIVKDQMVYHRTEDFHRIAWWTLGTGLFTTEGEHHRKQRRILNPVFSAAHLRNITPLFYDVASQVGPFLLLSPDMCSALTNRIPQLRNGLEQQVTQGEAEVRLLRVDNDTELMVTEQVDMLNWMTRTALELIGRGALGYSFATLKPNAGEHRYAKSIKNMIITMNDPLILGSRAILGHLTPYMGTRSFQRWAIEMLPWPKLREAKAMSDLIWNTSKEILENTKKCLAEGVESDTSGFGGCRDILSIFGGFPSGSPRNPRPMLSSRSIPVKANMDAPEEDKLPEDEIMGQVSSITFAGMDTTSNALSRILHLLSERPDVQDRLRDEIKDAVETHGEELDYSTLNSLPFLEAVVRETLRLYAPAPSAARVPQQDMVLPLSKPVKMLDGEERHELIVPKGTLVFLQLIKCNRDKDIWGPDAEEWKPERWLTPLPSSVTEANVPGVYANLMTFLGGGRACIGFKFALLEISMNGSASFSGSADDLTPEVVLITLLRSFRFAPTDKKIIWQLTPVIQPTTEDAELTEVGTKKLQLPLRVSLL
ncbi:hypothetical protein NMY22_g309 [Coprinellus aureogranulatus]|nr:hypothetical protein NMY22_g309 [Coprinellus aureogranulatus]